MDYVDDQHQHQHMQQQQQQQQQQQRQHVDVIESLISPPPPPPPPPPSASSSSTTTTQSMTMNIATTTTDHGGHPIKICRVCGEKANGFNQGGLCCESCKAFFRRNVLSITKKPVCAMRGQCPINMQTRRTCSACRFQKCLAIGMKVDRLLKKKKKNKQQQGGYDQGPTSVPKMITPDIVRPLSAFERSCLKTVSEAISCVVDEHGLPFDGGTMSMIDCFEKTPIYVRQFIDFAKHFPVFYELQSCDQISIIKKSFPGHILLRSAFCFRSEIGFLVFMNDECKQCQVLSLDQVSGVMEEPKLRECLGYSRIYCQEMGDDRILQGLFNLLQLFYPNGEESCGHFLTYYYNFYRHLLRRYLVTKHGSNYEGARRFHRITIDLGEALKKHLELFFAELVYKLDFNKLSQLALEMYNLYN